MNRYLKFLILLTIIIFNDSYFLYSDTLEGISISYGKRTYRSITSINYNLNSNDYPSNKQGPYISDDNLFPPDVDSYKIFSIHLDFKEKNISKFFYWDYYLNYYNLDNNFYNDNNSYFMDKYFSDQEKIFVNNEEWGIEYVLNGGSINLGINISPGIQLSSNHRIFNVNIGMGFSYIDINVKNYIYKLNNIDNTRKNFDDLKINSLIISNYNNFFLYKYQNNNFYINLIGRNYFYENSLFNYRQEKIISRRNIKYYYYVYENYTDVINFGIKF